MASDIRKMRDMIASDIRSRSADANAIQSAMSTFTNSIEKLITTVMESSKGKEQSRGTTTDKAGSVHDRKSQVLQDYLKMETCLEIMDHIRGRIIYPPPLDEDDICENASRIVMNYMNFENKDQAVEYLKQDVEGRRSTIGSIMEWGRGRALQFIRIGCVSAFIRNCPNGNPIHRCKEDISNVEKKELRTIIGRDEYKVLSSYANACLWGVRHCFKEA